MKIIDKIDQVNELTEIQPGDVLRIKAKDCYVSYWMVVHYGRSVTLTRYALVNLNGGVLFSDDDSKVSFIDTGELLSAINNSYPNDCIEKVDATLTVRREKD